MYYIEQSFGNKTISIEMKNVKIYKRIKRYVIRYMY